ncbi:MAG TPA: hypothetical protein VL098_00575 [Flavipsychrobacter sp.]|nr:hypothetical protein [Flavipsychrobacter sp.]
MKRKLLLLPILLFSIAGSAQWTQIYTDPSMGAMQTIALNKDTVFVSRNWDLIFKTTDGGATWDTISFFNSNSYRMHFTDASHGFVAGTAAFISGPTCFKTSDCGITWQPMNFSAGAPAFTADVHFLNVDTGFITDGSVVAKTTDGGNTFQALNIVNGNVKVNDLHFTNNTTGFAAMLYAPIGSPAYTENRIYKTTDQGVTWTLVHADTDMGNNSFVFAGIVEVSFVNDTFGVAVGGEGKILKTTDAGSTWVNVPNSFNDFNITDVQFLTQQKGYICYAGKMYFTADGMQTWSLQQDSTFDYYSISMLDEHSGYAAGHGIFKQQTEAVPHPFQIPGKTNCA